MSISILVVDDESDVGELFRQRFRRETRQGTYVLHFALSAEEALDKLSDEIRPELIVILSDINMPGMDALTLFPKSSRDARPAGNDGAYGDEERRRQARRYGATEFITKPVDFDALKAQLQQLSTSMA